MRSGAVRFGYFNYAFLRPESLSVAAASECAAEQERFWQYHDYIFANWSSAADTFSKESLKRYGAAIGLDTGKFNECVDSGRTEALVQQDIAFAQQLGVTSTPTFAVNGKAIQGALPFDNFQQIIQQEQAKAG